MTDGDGPSPEISVRLADGADLPQVMNVLDWSRLDIGAERVGERIDAGRVLVASEAGENSERLRGALVLSGPGDDTHSETEIEAIAVRRRDRNRGIASALVERARREVEGALVAAFDVRVRPFYASLGFEIHSMDDGRFRGRDARR